MLHVASSLRGCTLEASDGHVGKVEDLLFDDRTWRLRWLVIDTGSWLTGRSVLLQPSCIVGTDIEERSIRASLTRAKIKGSPGIGFDQPVSLQFQNSLFGYYGWDSEWGTGLMAGGGYGFPSIMRPASGDALLHEPTVAGLPTGDGDPHLRSVKGIAGYHMRATDGGIGHLEDQLIDITDWGLRYLIIDTRNWWPGREVLLAPYAVTKIDWISRQIDLDVSRDQVMKSPRWSHSDNIDRAYEEGLHTHYGWPGYGW
jgi:hypothetical protein